MTTPTGLGPPVVEASPSHSDTPHSLWLLWTSGQPDTEILPDNTKHSQETDIHESGGIRTRNPSKRSAADPRHKPRGHSDRQFASLRIFNYVFLCNPHIQIIRLIWQTRPKLSKHPSLNNQHSYIAYGVNDACRLVGSTGSSFAFCLLQIHTKSVTKDWNRLGCYAVSTGKELPRFLRIAVSPSSGLTEIEIRYGVTSHEA